VHAALLGVEPAPTATELAAELLILLALLAQPVPTAVPTERQVSPVRWV